MNFEVRPIQFGSSEYESEVQLRYEILRKPLGLQFKKEDLEREADDLHLGTYSNQILVGCLILTPISDVVVKMRQVAIALHMQGQGVGKKLVKAAEKWAVADGYESITLNARETAIPFYLALDYQLQGDFFSELNIPHKTMIKNLKNAR